MGTPAIRRRPDIKQRILGSGDHAAGELKRKEILRTWRFRVIINACLRAGVEQLGLVAASSITKATLFPLSTLVICCFIWRFGLPLSQTWWYAHRPCLPRRRQMGRYVINGEVVDLREDAPTAADVKRAAGSPQGDWVMATMPGGQVVKLNDTDPLPSEADDLSIVPAFQYG